MDSLLHCYGVQMNHDIFVKWIEECEALLDRIDFETTDRARVSVSLLHLSLEHQKSISLLSGSPGNLNGSSLALLRPQFEAYVRGLWFNRCASEAEIDGFIKGTEPPRINKLIEAIEKTPGFMHGELMHKKTSVWRALNDYTHGGVTQVKARNSGNQIIQNYSEEHLLWLLNFSSYLGLLAGIEISGVANNSGIAGKLLAMHKSIFPPSP